MSKSNGKGTWKKAGFKGLSVCWIKPAEDIEPFVGVSLEKDRDGRSVFWTLVAVVGVVFLGASVLTGLALFSLHCFCN